MFRTPVRWLLADLFALLAGQTASAQLKIAYDAQAEPNDLQRIALRPNVTQPIYFSYFNPGPGAKKNVKVTLEQIGSDGKIREIAKTTVAKVDLKRYAPVSFASIAAPKESKDPAAPWPKLEGPPFAFRF